MLRIIDQDRLGITVDETTTDGDLAHWLRCSVQACRMIPGSKLPGTRQAEGFMTQAVFHQQRSETEMMRFLRRLADKDLALTVP